jgi:hypothetical protein
VYGQRAFFFSLKNKQKKESEGKKQQTRKKKIRKANGGLKSDDVILSIKLAFY